MPPKHTFLSLQQRNKSEDQGKINRINKAVKDLTDQNLSDHQLFSFKNSKNNSLDQDKLYDTATFSKKQDLPFQESN